MRDLVRVHVVLVVKSVGALGLLSHCDLMWFCVPCHEKVQKNIITDMKIEERCKEIMRHYEERIAKLETDLSSKCSENRVREIIQEEIRDRNLDPPKQGADSGNVDEGEGGDSNVVTSVMSELNERKQRELNLVIYGVKESDSEIREDRIYYDRQKVIEIGAKCDVILRTEDIGKTVRLGKFDKDKRKRPILVSLKALEHKRNILRGARNLKDEDSNSELELRAVRIANDLTRAEREQEKQLFTRAKELQQQESGDFIYRVRGPPWARRVAKIKLEDK